MQGSKHYHTRSCNSHRGAQYPCDCGYPLKPQPRPLTEGHVPPDAPTAVGWDKVIKLAKDTLRLAFAHGHSQKVSVTFSQEQVWLLCRAILEASETYTDGNGAVWRRPTAWAYAQACKARTKWQQEAVLAQQTSAIGRSPIDTAPKIDGLAIETNAGEVRWSIKEGFFVSVDGKADRRTLHWWQPVRIIKAAIKTPDGVIHSVERPGRHHTIIHKLVGTYGGSDFNNQGFVTSTNRYVDRREAMGLACFAGQLRGIPFQPDVLFSEDLW